MLCASTVLALECTPMKGQRDGQGSPFVERMSESTCQLSHVHCVTIIITLFARERASEQVRVRALPSTGLLPRCLPQPALVQPKLGAGSPVQVSTRVAGPQLIELPLLPPRVCIKQESWNRALKPGSKPRHLSYQHVSCCAECLLP